MISLRLKTIGDMVTTKHVIDVGCDHALLSIYLAQKGISSLDIDVNKYAIAKAEESVYASKQQDKIKLLVNDGLSNIDINNDDTVTISGLGTNTILKIIGNRKINNLIISSNNDLPLLRKELNKKGYIIKDEQAIVDKNIHYVIIYFVLGKCQYNYMEYLYGPIILKRYLDNQEYLLYIYNTNTTILSKLPNKYILKKIELKKEIKYLKKYLK
jgi:tRNA A22 N-methylase